MAKIKRDPKAVALAKEILEHYNPESVEDVDEALKEIYGPLFESLLQSELISHLVHKILKKLRLQLTARTVMAVNL